VEKLKTDDFAETLLFIKQDPLKYFPTEKNQLKYPTGSVFEIKQLSILTPGNPDAGFVTSRIYCTINHTYDVKERTKVEDNLARLQELLD
jgi:hypothetical protein